MNVSDPAKPTPPDSKSEVVFAGLLGTASILEGTALYFALDNGYGWAMLFHLTAALVFLIWPMMSRRRPDALKFRTWCILVGCLTLFVPVMGILGSAVTCAAVRWMLRQKGVVQDYETYTGYVLEDGFQLPDAKDPRMLLSDELSIEPFLDILSGGDEDLKRGALNMLGRMGTPEAIRLLKRCITDPSTDVRFYAHSTLTKLDERHVLRIKEIKALSDAGGPEQVPHLIQLGEACAAYADSGLLEGETRTHYLLLARKAYDEAFDKDPSVPDLLLRMGRIHMETGDIRNAAACFKKGLKDDRTAVEAFLGLCRIFYDRGEMRRVAQLIKQVRPRPEWQTKTSEDALLFAFWTTPERAAAHEGPGGET